MADIVVHGYFAPWTLGIVGSLLLALIIATIIACYYDIRGYLQSAVTKGDFPPPTPLAPRRVPHKTMFAVSKKSEEEPLLDGRKGGPLDLALASNAILDVNDLLEERTQLSQAAPLPCLDDAEAKHARIIEAIYLASGREVPEIFRRTPANSTKSDSTQKPSQLETIGEETQQSNASEKMPGMTPTTHETPTRTIANSESVNSPAPPGLNQKSAPKSSKESSKRKSVEKIGQKSAEKRDEKIEENVLAAMPDGRDVKLVAPETDATSDKKGSAEKMDDSIDATTEKKMSAETTDEKKLSKEGGVAQNGPETKNVKTAEKIDHGDANKDTKPSKESASKETEQKPKTEKKPDDTAKHPKKQDHP